MDRLRIGVIGCGNISMTYMRNAALFNNLALVACADINRAAAELRASEYGIAAMGVDELLASDQVDMVLNLTIPTEHHPVSLAALRAGKHVFTEKPLATSTKLGAELVAEAAARGLALGSAPDTWIGASGRRARALIDQGAIGEVITGTAYMLGHGMEHWHPAPEFYYQPGGGPILDMGPYYIAMLLQLLGPVRRVMAMGRIGNASRHITAEGPNAGTSFAVNTETTAMAVIAFASGTLLNLGISWDVWAHNHPNIELYGSEGALRLPDPDIYGGDVQLSRAGGPWETFASEDQLLGAINWPHDAPRLANYRMTAVAEMADAIRKGRSPRASGANALHVLEVLEAVLTSSREGRPVEITTPYQQPAGFPDAEIRALMV